MTNYIITDVYDVEDLRGRILHAWEELDQCIIKKAVGQWRKRLCALLMLSVDNSNTVFEW